MKPRLKRVKGLSRRRIEKIKPTIEKLTKRFCKTSGLIGKMGEEDLQQEAYLRIIREISKFSGRSSFDTWAVGVAVNILRDMARKEKRRPRKTFSEIGDDFAFSQSETSSHDDERIREIKDGITDLLEWLRDNPHEIKFGWETLNLMLQSGGDRDYVAVSLVELTGQPWTTLRVSGVIRRIKSEPLGQALCESAGIK